MGKNTRMCGMLSRLLFVLVFAASFGIFFLTRSGGWVDMAINLLFDVCAAVFLVIYMEGCVRPLNGMVRALNRVTDDIRSRKGTPQELWSVYGRETKPFNNKRLDERYIAYLRECHRQHQQNAMTADARIEDYITEDLLYAAVNKPFSDSVSGIMSGLGILFTFIGLVYGLRNFDASTVDAMQTSTQALMAGIKIAFLTSIFGLIFSLIQGVTYKRILKGSVEALYDFQDAYTECVRPTNENGAQNALLQYQQQQTEALNGFGTNIGTQVSDAIIQLMQPTVQQMQKTLQDYVTVSIEDQRSGMERVVRFFLDSMNSSMGDIFSQLREQASDLARLQSDMIQSINILLAGFERTGDQMQDAQAASQSIVTTMQGYTSAIEALTGKQQGVVRQMQDFMTDYQRLHEREAQYLQSLATSTETAAENSRKNLQTAQSVANIADAIREGNRTSADEIAQAGARMKQAAASVDALSLSFTSDINKAAARLEQSADRIDASLSQSVSESLSAIDQSLAKLAGAVGTMAQTTENVTRSMSTLPKTVSGVDADLKATVKSLEGELKLLLKAFSETQKIVSRYNTELERHTGV